MRLRRTKSFLFSIFETERTNDFIIFHFLGRKNSPSSSCDPPPFDLLSPDALSPSKVSIFRLISIWRSIRRSRSAIYTNELTDQTARVHRVSSQEWRAAVVPVINRSVINRLSTLIDRLLCFPCRFIYEELFCSFFWRYVQNALSSVSWRLKWTILSEGSTCLFAAPPRPYSASFRPISACCGPPWPAQPGAPRRSAGPRLEAPHPWAVRVSDSTGYKQLHVRVIHKITLLFRFKVLNLRLLWQVKYNVRLNNIDIERGLIYHAVWYRFMSLIVFSNQEVPRSDEPT